MFSSEQKQRNTGFPNATHVLYTFFVSTVALLITANWYMWHSIQTKLTTLEQNVAEQNESLQDVVTEKTERPSVEERAKILGTLEQNPEGLSSEERRAILNRLNNTD